ncbi:aldo/keto reductase [Abyssibius alkaniclasticus]|uniref:aldo/keto reductase n=1 Tax=Abyssibius alkaniclasticus TaxID=2881234 RepID=UPI004059463E
MQKIGLGTWPLKDSLCREVVATALELGYRHIDTAQMYANEAAVGQGIADAGLERDALFVVTKIWPSSFEDGTALARARASIAALGVGAVDQLLVHWPNPRLKVAQIIETLQAARDEGLAHSIGVSNFPSALMAEAAALDTIATNQVEFHALLDQRKLLAVANDLGIRLTAYMPIARGKVPEHPVVQDIAAAHSAQPAQVALAWVMAKGVTPICMSTKRANLASNLGACDLALSPDEIVRIDALSSPSQRFCERDSDNPDWDN